MSLDRVGPLKLTHPTQHPWAYPVGSDANLKDRNLQIWPTLSASIALFPCNFANKNETRAIYRFNFAFKVHKCLEFEIKGLE